MIAAYVGDGDVRAALATIQADHAGRGFADVGVRCGKIAAIGDRITEHPTILSHRLRVLR